MINNEHDFMLFAIRNYDNPQLESVDELKWDLNRFAIIKRSLDRYIAEKNIDKQLLINHFIVLGNVFGSSFVQIVKYKFRHSSDEHKSIIKSILLFLGWIDSSDMPEVKSDETWNKILRNV